MNATSHPVPAETMLPNQKHSMKTRLQSHIQPRRQWRTLNVFVGGLLALGVFAPAARPNGTAYYLDPNGGATAGFDVGSGTYAQSTVQWNPSATGIGTLVAFPTASPYYQMSFGLSLIHISEPTRPY